MTVLVYGFIFLISLAFSVGGVFLTVHLHPAYPEDGTRGGAIAVAISFAFLFVRQPYWTFRVITEERNKLDHEHRKFEKLLNLPKEEITSTTPETLLQSIKEYIEDEIEIMTETETREQTIQNWFLAASSVLGTIFWGFGDWFVYWIEAGKIYLPPS